MIVTVQECVDMSELSNEAIRAIAEHEHIPEVVAAELGQELLKGPVASPNSADVGGKRKARHAGE